MSDVEQILDANFQRVQWAREVEAGLAVEQGQRATKKPNPQRCRGQVMHTVSLACAMFAGSGAAFAGLGLATGDWRTMGVGVIVAAIFLLSGTKAEEAAWEYENERK